MAACFPSAKTQDMETQHVPTGCIVVGVDASQPTDRALDWAGDQALLEQRHLLLVHGTGSPLVSGSTWSGIGGPDPLNVFADLQAAGHGLLARATTRVVTRHPELVVHQVVRPVDPSQALLDVSREAALVVVGSRGRGHVLSMVLGSVSEEVVGRSTCPVVVIRPQHDTERRHGVLVGTDGTRESVPVLRFAYRQARLRNLPLTVMQSVWDVTASTAGAYVVPLEDVDDVRSRLAVSDAVADLAAEFPEVSTTLTIGHGAPAECLLAVADTMDLVVVGHHERGLLGRLTHGSVAVAVLEHASVPVAVVPVDAGSLAPTS
jgi:nucleotide-binding universal stress UspA family protein